MKTINLFNNNLIILGVILHFNLIITSAQIIIKPLYCTPTSTYGTLNNRYINSVQLGTIKNLNTGANPGPSYTSYTSTQSTVLYKDSTYSLKVTGGPSYSLMHYLVWIDYNEDRDFTDPGEKIGEQIATSANQTLTFPFTVPSGSITGSTRMRITCVYNVTAIDPCATYGYGETEDYLVNLENAAIFRRLGTGMVNTRIGAVRWVDIDSDNDLDICITGTEGNFNQFIPRGKIYYNYGNDSVHFKSNIIPLGDGDIKWCDFNRDGNMDMLYSGSYLKNSDIFQAYAGIKLFSGIGAGDTIYFTNFATFIGLSNASVDWGDYDNDGDFDVVITGFNNTTERSETYLYKNNMSNFSVDNQILPGVTSGKIQFIDFDLDGDLDLFMTGSDINLNTLTALFENSNGIFSPSSHTFENLKASDFDWGDINGDNYPDLLIIGTNGISNSTKVYYNDGKKFTESNIHIPGTYNGSCLFSDVDNDGDLDILISGSRATSDSLKQYPVFLNMGNETFEHSLFTMDNNSNGTSEFGDIDNDNDADLLVNGYKYINMSMISPRTYLFKNETATINQKPAAPTNLYAITNGRDVSLYWYMSTDNNTPQKSLSYNITVSTDKNLENIVASNANRSTGFRKISGRGYILTNSWNLNNLQPGKYYWKVQAIDNSFAASAFSSIDSFEIKNRFTITQKEVTSVFSPITYFDYDNDNDFDAYIYDNPKIYNLINKSLNPFVIEDTINSGLPDMSSLEYFIPNDLNNDNNFELAVAGVNYSNEDTLTYFYDYGPKNTTIALKINNIPKINNGYFVFNDFDNDGWQDIIMSGVLSNIGMHNTPVTYVFKNLKNGTFEKQTHNLPILMKCRATVSDFDNDKDADIIIYGLDSKASPGTYLCLNNGNFNFTVKRLSGLNFFASNYKTFNILNGDYNNDGSPDILIAAQDSFLNNFTKVYVNDSLDFVDQNLLLRSQSNASAYWADYDYDGDLDIFVMRIDYKDALHLYLNENGTFEEITYNINNHAFQLFPFMAANFDNKSGLDCLISYSSPTQFEQLNDNWGKYPQTTRAPTRYISKLIKNTYVQEGSDIILYWATLPTKAFTYNLCVGTTKTNCNIMAPLSNLTTGYHYISQPGNAYQNYSWRIKNLPVGKYYWKVQAIDLAYKGSIWSPIDSFTVSAIDPDFSSNEVCYGETTQLTDLSVSTSPITKWKWIFEDNSVSQEQNPARIFTRSGTINVTLWVYTEKGDSAKITKPVSVLHSPKAAFFADPVCFGSNSELINKSDTTKITVSSWLWNFGNGETSTQRGNVTKTYIKTDTASLTISATNGCTSSDTVPVIIGNYPDVNLLLQYPHSLSLCDGDSSRIYIETVEPFIKYIWNRNNTPFLNQKTNELYVKYDGYYHVTAVETLANCSTNSNAISFTVSQKPLVPEISIILGDSIKCPTDSIVLSISNTDSSSIYSWYKNGNLFQTDKNTISGYLNEGEYYAKANKGNCASNSRTIILENKTQPPKPKISANNGPDIYYMTCSNSTADVYRWYYNGSIIPNAQSHYIIVGKKLGTYYVEIEEEGKDCASRSDNITIPKEGAINSSTVEQSFDLYPNPVQNILNLKFIDNYCGIITVKITNVYGITVFKEWYDKTDTEYNKSIQLNNLNNGLYHITIEYNQHTISKSLLINK